jgi:hypothetical protein
MIPCCCVVVNFNQLLLLNCVLDSSSCFVDVLCIIIPDGGQSVKSIERLLLKLQLVVVALEMIPCCCEVVNFNQLWLLNRVLDSSSCFADVLRILISDDGRSLKSVEGLLLK